MKHLILFENYEEPFLLTNISAEEIDDFAGHIGLADDIEFMYQTIEGKDSITLFRVIGIRNGWIVDYEDAGLHWTFDSSMYGTSSFFEDIVLPHGYDKYIVIEAEVPTKSIDRKTTYQKNSECPSEMEVTLFPSAKYKVLSKKEFTDLDELIAAYNPASEFDDDLNIFDDDY